MNKVLVVDDEANICNLLAKFLPSKGYSVITASSGEEAIKKVQREKPNLVLLDICLPDMNGLEVLQRIKVIDKSIGVIMATALKEDEIGQKALESGADDYLTKPIDFEFLEKSLKEVGQRLARRQIKDQDICELLLEKKVINKAQLEQAKKIQELQGLNQPIGAVIRELGFLSHGDYSKTLEILAKMASSGHKKLKELGLIDADLIDFVGLQRAKEWGVFPLLKRKGVLGVMMRNPQDLHIIDDLKFIYGALKVEPARFFDEKLFDLLLEEGEAERAGSSESMRVLTLRDDELEVDKNIIESAKIINKVNAIISRALKEEASDIHFEPMTEHVARVRFRVDGALLEKEWIETRDFPAIISRIKVMANLDIYERRNPLDGQIRLLMPDYGAIDFRLSTIPTHSGEKAVLRVLDPRALARMSLDALGMPKNMIDEFKRLIEQPQGLILITGPTGSGKTTTLYSAIKYLLGKKGEQINIATAEDPVEYKIPEINQTQVNEKMGLTFPRILRAILRQDPDLILVGEIRDLETAETAMRASETGHMVVSTLHTNDAPATITRLIDIGVPPYQITSTLLCIMSQRLIRKNCDYCTEPYLLKSDDSAVKKLKAKKIEFPFYFKKGVGCEHCNHTGYKGRIGLYSFLPIDNELRGLINSRVTDIELRGAARAKGMKTVEEYGLMKVVEGLTTPEELFSKVGEEEE